MIRPATPRSARGAGGFTLVELMIVVAMIGILSAIALPAFSRYVKKSRTAEAITHVQKLWAGAVAYYEADHADPNGTVLQKQFPGGSSVSHESICSSYPDKMCPASPPVYEIEPWKSLNFSIPSKHHYRPVYFAWPNPRTDLYYYVEGDLDGDNVLARFEIRVTGVAGNGQDTRTSPPPPFITNEIE